MSSPQMTYYGGYPVNHDQMQSSHFGYDHNPFNNPPNFSSNQDAEQPPINTFPASNSHPELGVKSEEPTDFPVNSSISGNNSTNNQNIVNSSPSYGCKPEFLANSVDNALQGAGLSKNDNAIPPKIGKVSRSTHRPKLPQQTLTSSRSTQKIHSKSRTKTTHQEVSTESSSKDVQQFDPFAQWHQIMLQYYSQFYPAYQIAPPQVLPQQSTARLSTNNSSKTPASHSLNPTIKHGPEGFQVPSVNQTVPFDYANYYYQCYAAAAQFWSGGHPYQFFGTGIPETPHFYNTPHIKAWISCPGVIVQVLPSRPRNGEFARVEIINLFELVNEAVADAKRRASDNTTHTCDSEFSQQQPSEQNRTSRLGQYPENTLFNITDSGMQTPSQLSSIDIGGAEDDGEEIRACVMAAACWNQAEHQVYPGPLNRVGTLKADVLAFLREKLTEIQDRLPIDWESAGLLLMFLETLVKNNGNLQTSDLVNLLLEGHKPTTDSFRSGSYGYSSSSYLGVQVPVQYTGTLNNYNHQVGEYINESLASLPGSQVTSGRESPESHFKIDYGSSLLQHSKAASETGRMSSVQNIIRRMGGVHIGERGLRSQESEGKLLDRFRELLMHGLPMKALEHACRSKLWGHAFTLAHRMGPSTFAKVMDRFLNNDISLSDPILTLYQLTAGEMPQSINTAAYGRGIDNGDWRPHLAMILAGHSSQSDLSLLALERLGDGLLSRKHVYAAHLCYLLMNSLKNIDDKQREFRLPGKIWLIGVPPNHITSSGDVINNTSDEFQEDNIASNHILSPLFATSEAIQLTEIYEYSIQLANRKFHLRQLMPFRLVYAIRLLDAGFIEKAYRYLTAIGNEILTEFDEGIYQLKHPFVCNNDHNNNNTYVDPLLYSLINNCLRLAEPLQYHPEIESFDLLQSSTNSQLMDDYSFGFQFKNSSYSMPVQNKNKNWIERLNQIFNQMNQKIDHPRYKPSVIKSRENPSKDVRFTNEANEATEYSDHNDFNHYHQSSQPLQQQQQQQQQPLQQQQQQRQYHQFNKESNYKPSVEYRSNIQTLDSSSFLSTDNRDQRKLFSHEPFNQQSPSSLSSAPSHEYSYQSEPYNQLSSHSTSNLIQHNDNIQHNYSMNSPVQLSNYPMSLQSNQSINSVTVSKSSSSSSSVTTTLNEMSSSIFMPINHQTDSQLIINNDNNSLNYSTLSNQQPFDYFANIQSIHSRSRTVSGNSENNTVNMTNSTTVDQLDPSSNNRSLLSTKYETSFTNEHHFQQQSKQSISNLSQMNYLPQPSRHPSSMMNDNLKDYHNTFSTPTTATTSTTNSNHNSSNERFTQDKSNDLDNLDKNEQQSKDGWLSGWFGRLKKNGPKNIHLPDDSKPSIVWDDRLKQWIDVNDPDGSESNKVPPPPPAPASSFIMQKNDDSSMS
ncbi:rgpr-related [Schistosoma mansoni]|uniref:rgpr-related n=1 Tax=Schistosoma mansoni TaxID=6183 RepID=UPI00022DC396|nr:rgpr-related [Schistosoma mansoni]|eukprot:XP_018652912.1 rgpr-related [Schistosoma mansoni]